MKRSLHERYSKAVGEDTRSFLFNASAMSATLSPDEAVKVVKHFTEFQGRDWRPYRQRFADGSVYVGISSTNHRPHHFQPLKHNRGWSQCHRKHGNPEVQFLHKAKRREAAELEKALVAYYRREGRCLNVMEGGEAPNARTATKISVTLKRRGGSKKVKAPAPAEKQESLL